MACEKAVRESMFALVSLLATVVMVEVRFASVCVLHLRSPRCTIKRLHVARIRANLSDVSVGMFVCGGGSL